MTPPVPPLCPLTHPLQPSPCHADPQRIPTPHLTQDAAHQRHELSMHLVRLPPAADHAMTAPVDLAEDNGDGRDPQTRRQAVSQAQRRERGACVRNRGGRGSYQPNSTVMEVDTTNSTGGGCKLLSLLGRMQAQALPLTWGVKVGSMQLLPVGHERRAAAKGAAPGEQGRREHLRKAVQ